LIAIDYCGLVFFSVTIIALYTLKFKNQEIRIRYAGAMITYLFLALLIVVFVIPNIEREARQEMAKMETIKLVNSKIIKF
jgi:hypothetical protein